jgi:ATP-dependent protease ClpP protease subunit
MYPGINKMGKFRELLDHLNQIDRKQEQAAKAFAKKVDQHARKVSSDIDRESKKTAQRIVKLEKRITVLERRLQKAK